MPRAKLTTKSNRKRTRAGVVVREAPVLRVVAPKKEVLVTETTQFTTEPKIEVRKPATLAQALTEPATAVVKPETKARVVKRTVKRRAA
jgi:hypothetical protein